MEDGGGPWAKGEAGGMASAFPPVGSSLKHVQVQAGNVRGEFMGGIYGKDRGPHAPAASPHLLHEDSRDLGSSVPAMALRQQCWDGSDPCAFKRSLQQAQQRAPRPAGYGAALLHAALPRSHPAFFGKASNNSLFRVNSTSLGRSTPRSPSPLPAAAVVPPNPLPSSP